MGSGSDDQQQTTTAVPTDLLNAGEHFNYVPDSLLQLHWRQHAGIELPRGCLLQMIVDGHWQRPTRLGNPRSR